MPDFAVPKSLWFVLKEYQVFFIFHNSGASTYLYRFQESVKDYHGIITLIIVNTFLFFRKCCR